MSDRGHRICADCSADLMGGGVGSLPDFTGTDSSIAGGIPAEHFP